MTAIDQLREMLVSHANLPSATDADALMAVRVSRLHGACEEDAASRALLTRVLAYEDSDYGDEPEEWGDIIAAIRAVLSPWSATHE